MNKHVLTPVVLTARVDANAEQGHERLVVHLACMLGKGRQQVLDICPVEQLEPPTLRQSHLCIIFLSLLEMVFLQQK